MHTTTVRYPDDIWQMLTTICDEGGIAKAQYIREATIMRLFQVGRELRVERVETTCAHLLRRMAWLEQLVTSRVGAPASHYDRRARRYAALMSESGTTTIEIDTDVLNELRAEEPGKPDRELIEDLAKLKVDFATIRRLQERFNIPEDEADAVGVEAARAARSSR
jgi:hypothetical protein